MFPMFQVIYAHEWMNDAHEYEMQVQLGKNNTRGVTERKRGDRRGGVGNEVGFRPFAFRVGEGSEAGAAYIHRVPTVGSNG